MAIDLETILRRIEQKTPNLGTSTAPATGGGLTGLGGRGGTSPLPSNLQTGYNPGSLGLGGGQAGSTRPNYNSVDDMGFDSYYEGEMGRLQRGLSDSRSQFDLANQRDTEDYERSVRDTNQQQELDASALLDRLANQGILRSGVQVKAQGDLGESYQRRLADLERRKTEGSTGRQTEFSNYQRDVNDSIAQLQQERTRREAERQRLLAEQQAQLNPTGQYNIAPIEQLLTGNTPQHLLNTPGLQDTSQFLNESPEGAGYLGGPSAGDTYSTWVPPTRASMPTLQRSIRDRKTRR